LKEVTGEKLREITDKTRTERAERKARCKAENIENEKKERRRRKRELNKFLEENTEVAIEKLSKKAIKAANKGNDRVKKEWRIPDISKLTVDDVEYEKHIALRDCVAEHFEQQGLDVEPFDIRPTYTDRDRRVQSARYTLIGVTVNWAEQES